MRGISPEIQTLIGSFTTRLMEAVSAQTGRRIQGIVAAAIAGAPAASGMAKRPGGRLVSQARRLSDKAIAVRKLQGRYIGALRSLPPAARARVKKTAREEGVAAAVNLALKLK